ncbi:hypothetical protein HZH66_012482 [Vespula vulgaris]|uniref:Uncharacterized protein n=1 Tax=Vespula vulgaris TaxID=7454 RepID=A0A834JA39_VESVU|nr:hypothetical protein HZH66_012482 [Vespula vulgaris]
MIEKKSLGEKSKPVFEAFHAFAHISNLELVDVPRMERFVSQILIYLGTSKKGKEDTFRMHVILQVPLSVSKPRAYRFTIWINIMERIEGTNEQKEEEEEEKEDHRRNS